MKHTALLALIPVLILAAISAFVLSKRPRPAPVAPPPQAAVPTPTETGAPPPTPPDAAHDAHVKNLYQSPRAPLPVPANEKVSAPCLTLWEHLRGYDLANMEHPAIEKPLPPTSDCLSVPPELTKLHEGYRELCGNLGPHPDLPSAEWTAKASRCQAAAFTYRASVTDYLTRDKNVRDITDPRVLTDKFTASMNTRPAAAAEAAERLLELDPAMTPAAKGSLLGRFIDAQANAAGKPDDKRWEKFDDSVKRMKGMGNANDQRQTLEAEAMANMMRYQNPQAQKDFTQKLSRDNPSLMTGPYYGGWAEYMAGNKNGALEQLAEAERRDPSDARTKETIRKVKNGEKDPFQALLSVEMDASPQPR